MKSEGGFRTEPTEGEKHGLGGACWKERAGKERAGGKVQEGGAGGWERQERGH
eukprot:CAMPEP_0172165350 /NCGR_PEP_ID=MMETSP1050-20130122/8362_1 /TAXON_ID=233186 /ORGANISM="Cryptomonas curvata, Strain CCAP979/52" /LENGTH=52 /DNA_ID=CAMNT_0012835809 /DNA_START=95 /DNA_END=253 /DNA_ORIENTATION=+